MNNLMLNSEMLNNVLENKNISYEDSLEVFQDAKVNPSELISAAQNLRTI
jgi:FO synthase